MRASLRQGLGLALTGLLVACAQGPQEGTRPGPIGPHLGGPWGKLSLPLQPHLDLVLDQLALTRLYRRPSDGRRVAAPEGGAFFRVLLRPQRVEEAPSFGRRHHRGLELFPESDLKLFHQGRPCRWRRDLSELGLGLEGDASASSFPLGVGLVSLVFEAPAQARRFEAFFRLGTLGWQHLEFPLPASRPAQPSWGDWLRRWLGLVA